MKVAAVILVLVLIFAYIELAIGFGYYMFLLTSKRIAGEDKDQRKQIIKYSIMAGIAFPVTFAILIASKAAGRG